MFKDSGGCPRNDGGVSRKDVDRLFPNRRLVGTLSLPKDTQFVILSRRGVIHGRVRFDGLRVVHPKPRVPEYR